MRIIHVIASLLALGTASAHAASIVPVASFGANPGGLAAYEYVPDGLPAGRPLVVVLHGCTQQATSMQNAGWNALADAHGFAVLYPEQQTANNPIRCFNWAGEHGDPANLVRGQGENASIIAMIDGAIAAHASDPKRVYITGMSAGAAFTAVMLATWPERFAAGAIMAGVPYRCATDLNAAFGCQNPGRSKSAREWGDLVRAASGGFSGAWPRVQIWHGTMDTTLAPMNADELVEQWTDVHGVDATADTTETIGAATWTHYGAVELVKIAGMGHAIAIDDTDCPATAAAFFANVGVCSTREAAVFFGLVHGSGSGSGSTGDPGPGSSGERIEGGFGCSAAIDPAWFAMLAIVGLRRRRQRPTIEA